jgi:hypothetical protein
MTEDSTIFTSSADRNFPENTNHTVSEELKLANPGCIMI